MTDRQEFDLVVIGGGTGANGVARVCAAAGWNVASVDVLPFGGTCALRGCDPKKMLVGVTEALDWSRRLGGKGIVGSVSIDWAEMMSFKRTFTDIMPGRVEGGLSKVGVTVFHGQARFVEADVVRVGDVDLKGKFFHIATGARPRTLGFEGEAHVLTSTDFLEFESLPPRLVFIGGGFISFEFAHIAKRAGASEVTILHRSARPLKDFDPDLVDLTVTHTRELGVDVRLNAPVVGVAAVDSGFEVRFNTQEGERVVVCDAVIHGAGRVANIDDLNLEIPGVAHGPGGIQVNASMRSTSNPNVFSAGDCADTGMPNLTPVSANEGRVVGKNLLAGEDVREVKYPPIPSAVFTVPPIGRVGMLEAEAKAKGLEYDVHFKTTGGWYSSLRVAEENTAFKVLVERGTGHILGAHLLGPGAEEQVNIFAIAMKVGMTANQMKGLIFAYPSFASDLGSMV